MGSFEKSYKKSLTNHQFREDGELPINRCHHVPVYRWRPGKLDHQERNTNMVQEAMVQSSKLGIWSGVDDVIRQHGICQLLGVQGRRRLPRRCEDRSASLWHT